VDDFVSEYAKGRTPNPCARCNEFIKFHTFLERATELDCEYIATGHYAQIEKSADKSTFILKRGLDQKKDQSYVLGMLTQAELARVLLPIGGMEKTETRRLAEEFGFCVARKPDSQEICFVEDGDYAKFVESRVPELAVAGPILDQDGKHLGEHKGLAHYTIGQRKGLGIAAPTPLFVTKIDTEKGAVIVGQREELRCDGFRVTKAKWTAQKLPESAAVLAQTRAHGSVTAAHVTEIGEDHFSLRFDQPQLGIAPGQMCVLYQGDEVRGAGTIDATY
jgi:tRNA-specific 2-thiouridylase